MPATVPFVFTQNTKLPASSLNADFQAILDYLNTTFSYVAPSTWVPTLSCTGAMTIGTTAISVARYWQIGKTIYFVISFTGTLAGTPSTGVKFTLPVTPATDSDNIYSFEASISDGGNPLSGNARYFGADAVRVFRYDSANWSAGASRRVMCSGQYEIS